jgi:hypothetical protein
LTLSAYLNQLSRYSSALTCTIPFAELDACDVERWLCVCWSIEDCWSPMSTNGATKLLAGSSTSAVLGTWLFQLQC